ncbi:MAG: PAS domain S-box protein [Burkholderiales bacterium]
MAKNKTEAAISAGNPPDVTAPPMPSDDATFRRLVEEIADYAIFMLTPDGRVATWNEGARRIKQYAAKEIIGQHFSKFYPQAARDSGFPAFELKQAAMLGRFEDEGWRVRKDGSQFWGNVVITALHEPGGQLIGFSKVTRDLSERKAQEERLRQSEENLRLLIEGVEDYAIYRLDTDGTVASWNRGAQRIKGYSADEIIGQHFSRFYEAPAVSSGWPEHELRVAAETGRFEDEGWRVRKDGSVFWANVIITAIKDHNGMLRGYSKITRDLTERRRHEESLKESEQRLRLLVNGVTDHAIVMLSPDAHFLGWNDGAERLYGYSSGESVGRGAEILYTPEDVASDRPQQDLQEAAARDSIQLSGWRVRRDGSRFWADITIAAVRHDNGSLRAYVQITKDVTQGRRIAELETKGKRIEEFIAMLAHELRNPLAPIGNTVALLRATASDSNHLRYADVIGRQVTHLSRLVDDLLDVGRMTSGKIRICPEDMDLGAVVAAAVESIRPLILSYEHVLQTSLPPAPVRMSGDPTRITQVVVNLLINAAKYTPRGGRIELSLKSADQTGILEVVDNGVGMSSELLVTAFDIFVQGDRALDRSEGGLGIGLPLVKRVVELHGGSIRATSGGTGQGCRMTVKLPLQQVSLAGRGRPSFDTTAMRSMSLLVVDDNLDARESLAALLSTLGHRVRGASDGPEALRSAAEDRPDAVLLDIGLPGLDGFEVARRLRAMPDMRTALLIATTGYAGEIDKLRAQESGFDTHLTKPVDIDNLLRALSGARPAIDETRRQGAK